VKGLKVELRSAVESQVPSTLERAFLIARVQQEVLEDSKARAPRPYVRAEAAPARAEVPKQLKLATGDLWKDRQLRDYRRANGLCFKCGDKFDPTHVCGQKPIAALNAMEPVECPVMLSEEVLNMLEMHDIAEAQQLSLSLHAMAGSEGAETITLRALVGNQVLLILVDSGSSGSFLHAQMLPKLNCAVKEASAVAVKVANS
jgi:hypothetical protein